MARCWVDRFQEGDMKGRRDLIMSRKLYMVRTRVNLTLYFERTHIPRAELPAG